MLALWEDALGQRGGARDAALLRASAPPEPGRLPTLGARNARLLQLHAAWFGRQLDLLSHCPACDAVAQFGGDCEAFAAQMQPRLSQGAPFQLEAQAFMVRFRLPDNADIDATADLGTGDAFANALLERCVLDCTRSGQPCPVSALTPAVRDAVSQRMAELDPGASLAFSLACPDCATGWQARLDVGDLVWRKVRASAERLLLDVDALARAYGWTEVEVLGLSPTRRAAYLQMVST
ncbi:MAG: hypothetical protein EOO24_50620 [Comamonadaceae bacterium]|nr:MAG: hypothetical protein EOO24_50620 [Comamonadaceae bacterium]